MAKKSMARRLKTLTKSKVSPKIIAGVIVLIGLIGLSFVGSSLLSTFNIAITNTNDSSKGGSTNEPGLVAYYRFDEGSGNTATDKIIQNNGTIYGAQWTDNAISGKALNFVGANNYVEVPHHDVLNLTDVITISVWIKLNKTVAEQTYQYMIVNKSNWTGKDGFQLVFNKPYSNNLIFRILYENTFKDAAWDASSLKKNIWYHLVGTYDKKFIKLFVDGQLKAIVSLSKPIDITTNKLYIGNPGADYFNGSIDEVKIYGKTLTDDEISAAYLNTRCKRDNIDPSNITGAQHNMIVNFPANLTTAEINGILSAYPWMNPYNLNACDKIFLIQNVNNSFTDPAFAPIFTY
ncbi:MAG: LamG domain-containing protein [Patescibacteria group bacterium]|jgi:hypothetical protein